ncbi:hypothetical protein MY10362_004784 [Beauveria mimosiformis]
MPPPVVGPWQFHQVQNASAPTPSHQTTPLPARYTLPLTHIVPTPVFQAIARQFQEGVQRLHSLLAMTQHLQHPAFCILRHDASAFGKALDINEQRLQRLRPRLGSVLDTVHVTHVETPRVQLQHASLHSGATRLDRNGMTTMWSDDVWPAVPA